MQSCIVLGLFVFVLHFALFSSNHNGDNGPHSLAAQLHAASQEHSLVHVFASVVQIVLVCHVKNNRAIVCSVRCVFANYFLTPFQPQFKQDSPQTTEWNTWSAYTGCTRTCGTDGIMTRTRACIGLNCIGEPTDTLPCNRQACTVRVLF
jgi:hypothetical protein